MMTKLTPKDQEKVVEDAAIRNKINKAIYSPTPRSKTVFRAPLCSVASDTIFDVAPVGRVGHASVSAPLYLPP